MPFKRLDKDIKQKILKLRKKGLSYAKIASLLQMSTNCVLLYCNPKSREKSRISANRYCKKHVAGDSDWNARRQREFYIKHPISFHRCQAQFHLKKLPIAERKKLFDEVM